MSTTLAFREARPASTAWNVVKTLLLTPLFWGVFYFALPAAVYLAEGWLGSPRFDGFGWQVSGVALFVVGSVLHLGSNLVMAVVGEGTPMTLDCPRKLVVAGPYRFVRNPMSVASVFQSVGVALFLGSPLVLVYAVLLMLMDNFLLRPHEEADLERRFGDAFRTYRRRVRCWRPRLRPYDPAREADEPPVAAERTTPPGRGVVLWDGHCKFCAPGARKLVALARPGALDLVNFQEPGALDRFPGVTLDACMQQMYLIAADGRVYGGFEAAVRAVATRPVLGWVAYLYYLPVVRLAFDLVYALVAANRYRIMGKAVAAGECEGGTCSLHFPGR
jgi:protein-S-isoprenylcysteine O-methyltransferase Ste14/predicted DCC family thiol-disulfide oxidoreductase YuxK